MLHALLYNILLVGLHQEGLSIKYNPLIHCFLLLFLLKLLQSCSS